MPFTNAYRDLTTPVMGAAGVVIASLFCATERYSDAATVGLLTVGLVLAVRGARFVSPTSLNPFEVTLLVWFVGSPIASCYFRLPGERSLITFDRIVVAALATSFLLGAIRKSHNSLTAARFEIAWGVLTLVALVSVASQANSLGFATRVAVDAFGLPLFIFFIARRFLDVDKCSKALVLGAMALALFLFATGAIELLSGADLFPFKGSELIRGGELRVNGPFSTDSSFAIVSLMLALFLRAAPRMLRVRFDAGAQFAWVGAMLAAAAAALMPVFRSVVAAGLVAWTLFEVLAARTALPDAGRRWKLIGRVVGVGGLTIALAMAAFLWESPTLAKRLFDPGNLYSRLATWEAGARMTADNPLVGVGLWNFVDEFERLYGDEDWTLEEALDTRIAIGAHSNLVWIATELGLLGLIPYVIANLCLLVVGIGGLKRAGDPRSRARAACFLSLMAAYWIPGLTLVSGAYSDLNLYYFFFLAILWRLMTDGTDESPVLENS